MKLIVVSFFFDYLHRLVSKSEAKKEMFLLGPFYITDY